MLVYGASSAGVAAAITASSNGTRVALVEPLAVAGGMLSAGGLYLQDQLHSGYSRFLVSGVARSWAERVRAHYNSSEDVLTPDAYVAQAAVDAMLAAQPSITVLTGCSLVGATRAGATLTAVALDCLPAPLSASIFIDASTTGDLMVAAGVPHALGRESRATYGESLAGVLGLGGGDGEGAFPWPVPAAGPGGSLLPGVSPAALPPVGAADGGLMAFGHRACITTDAATRVPFPPPPGYNRSDHALLQEVVAAAAAAGRAAPTLADFVGLIPYSAAVARAGRHKLMLCCGGWPVNGDAVTLGAAYVGAPTPAARAAAAAAHTRYLLGALHYLASDPAVPPATRADVGRYGLCGDEWGGGQPPHWPPQLYAREGARLVNGAVLTQASLVGPRGKADGIAVGAWYFDKHVVTRVADSRGGAANEGHFRAPTAWQGPASGWCRQRADQCQNVSAEWYEVPLGALLPRRADASNLVVPVALAASAVAFSSARIESMLMGTGAAAGVVARLAVAASCAVQDVPVAAVQAVLVGEVGAVIHGPPPPPAATGNS